MTAVTQPGEVMDAFNDTFRKHGYAEMVIWTPKGRVEPELAEQFPRNPRGR